MRVVKLPDVDAGFSPPSIDNRPPGRWNLQVVDLKQDFWGWGLQVIVRLASVHLTPESPDIMRVWCIERQLVGNTPSLSLGEIGLLWLRLTLDRTFWVSS